MWTKVGVFFFFGILLSACTKPTSDRTPEGALESYVNAAFSVKGGADKAKLLQLSIGEAHDQLQAMSDTDFVSRFGAGNIKLVSLKTKDRRAENDGGVSLVYELTYDQGTASKGPVTHKKIAYLQQEDGAWRIRGTKNIKEVVEQNEPMVIELTK